MARVDGFEVRFTHRGSWKADLLAPGEEADVVPVAWKTDWLGGSLFVWFKDEREVDRLLATGEPFRVAIAYKNANGSTSANNITAIVWVLPVEKSPLPRLGLHCHVEARAKPGDRTNLQALT